jgi:hypothetical protein
MSDREFAQLQMQRDAAPRGRQKADLTRRVNNEIARRKSSPAPAPPKLSSNSDELQGKMAKQTWTNLGKFARDHSGMVESGGGDSVKVHFPNPARAAGFYGQMRSRGLDAEHGSAPGKRSMLSKTVLVRKPR